MFQEQFQKRSQEEIKAVLELLNPQLDIGPLKTETSTMLSVEMPFYKGYDFLEITDHDTTPPLCIFALYNKKDRDAVMLDWTNGPIYKLNELLPIRLTKKNVGDYVRFFFSQVRGKHGRFVIVENVDDINWRESPPPAARKAIAKMITPVTFLGRAKDGSYQLSACMMFRDSLFKADIAVDAKGYVTLSNEELLVEDIPVLDDVLGQ